MDLDDLCTDTIYLIKKDGTRSGPAKGSVQGGKIMTADASLDIEDGDTLVRMAGPREESYSVIDNGYSSGMEPMIKPFYNATVRKSTAPAPAPRSVTTNFNTQIHGGSNIQIGTHNQMEVKQAVETIAQIINNSTATPELKTEAKGALSRFLEHPAIVAIVGGLSSGVAGLATK